MFVKFYIFSLPREKTKPYYDNCLILKIHSRVCIQPTNWKLKRNTAATKKTITTKSYDDNDDDDDDDDVKEQQQKQKITTRHKRK